MNTLSTLLQKKISSWSSVKELINMLSNGDQNENAGVKETEGVQGSLAGFVVAEYVRTTKKDIAIVVPTQKELQDICTDIQTYDDSVEILELPWWGTVPYRAAAKGSIIFGERASVLAKLCSKCDHPRVFIIQQ